jgi:hypothetical protein
MATPEKQRSDSAQGSIGTRTTSITPRESSASKGVPAHNPSGQPNSHARNVNEKR